MGNFLNKYYQNRSIRVKINLSVVGTVGIILVTLLTIVSLRSRSIVLKNAEKATIAMSKEYSTKAVEYMSNKAYALRMLGSSFESQYGLLDMKFDIYKNTIRQFAGSNNDIGAIWYLEDYSENGVAKNQRFIFSTEAGLDSSSFLSRIESDPEVNRLKSENDVWISEPVSHNGKWFFNMAIPYKHDGRTIGIVGFTIRTDYLQKMTESALKFEEGTCKIISWNGMRVTYWDKSKVGTTNDESAETDSVNASIRSKQPYQKYIWSETYHAKALKIFEPITLEGCKKAWSFCMVVPTSVVLKDSHGLILLSFVMMLFGLVVLVFVVNIISKKMSSPIIATSQQLTLISEGRLNEVSVVKYDGKDEVDEMISSLNSLIDSQKELAHFANEIGKGNLEVTITAKNNQDIISNAMIGMRQNLVEAKAANELRHIEDEIASWKITGNGRIHEEIRKENLSISHLCTSVLKEIVTYSRSIQGGIFVIDDSDANEPVVELVACIAYNRQKMMQKQLSINEGLVGRCIYEKAPILLNEIPQDYLSITSGLGENNPGFLALIPLLSNDSIVGVMEIASFKEMDKNTLEYLTKAGDSLASAVSNVRINERTQRLLTQSKHYAEEMGAQEEELRQNMEEMQAAQEEMYRKTREYEETISTLKEQLAANS